MATLYEIDKAILECVDAETGEIIDDKALGELELARDNKIENIACWIKNLKADVESYKKEKEVFIQKEKAAKNKAEGLTEDEVAEREMLRREYLKSIRNNVKGHLSKIKFVEDLSQEEIDELANKNNK